MRYRLTLPFALMAAALLAGCAHRTTPMASMACSGCRINNMAASEITVLIPKDSAQPVSYTWHGTTYQGEPALLAALPGELAAATNRIEPATQPPAGNLRLILPQRVGYDTIRSDPNPEGGAEARDALQKVNQTVDGARAGALQKSGLFTAVTVETAAAPVALPAAAPADYVLWLDGTLWKIRRGTENSLIVNGLDTTNLPGWIQTVSKAVAMIRQNSGLGLMLNYRNDTKQLSFGFMGQDYFSVDSLVPVMNEEFQNRARRTAVTADRLGGRAKLVLATGKAFTPSPVVGAAEDLQKQGHEASRLFQTARGQGVALALRQSRIFDQLDVITADQSEPALDGYNWVIWQNPTAPGQWRYRAAGGDDAFVVQTTDGIDPSYFPRQLTDAVRKAR